MRVFAIYLVLGVACAAERPPVDQILDEDEPTARAVAQAAPSTRPVDVRVVNGGSEPVPVSGAMSVSGTVAAAQSGSWAVAQSGSWTVAADQRGTWTVEAAQSGPWSVGAGQEGEWNVGIRPDANVVKLDPATTPGVTVVNSPTVALAAGTSVAVANSPTVHVASLPPLAIASATPAHVNLRATGSMGNGQLEREFPVVTISSFGYTVPAGKVVVVEQAGLGAELTSGEAVCFLYVSGQEGTESIQPLTLTQQTPTRYVGNHQLTVYLRAGGFMNMSCLRTSGTGIANFNLYLVAKILDAPATGGP